MQNWLLLEGLGAGRTTFAIVKDPHDFVRLDMLQLLAEGLEEDAQRKLVRPVSYFVHGRIKVSSFRLSTVSSLLLSPLPRSLKQ